jgi:hypothetical protein
MAIWNIDTFDSTDNANFSKFPAPYVEGVPQGVPRDGPQNNPFEGTASILGTYRSGPKRGSLVKYMHYCSRMLRWNDIDVTAISSLGTRDTCHKVYRFGDLGNLFGRGNDPDDHGLSGTTDPAIDYFPDSNMCRYRFDPITKVKYSQYTDRGMRYADQTRAGASISGHPFSNMTCGWSPNAEDAGFHWNPNSSELTQMSTDIAADLTTKGTTLAELQALDYTWNLCVIAWCWAGYRMAKGTTTYQGLQPGREGSRDVDEVDIYYFPFIF